LVKTPVVDEELEQMQSTSFTQLGEGNMLRRNGSESTEALGFFLMGFA